MHRSPTWSTMTDTLFPYTTFIPSLFTFRAEVLNMILSKLASVWGPLKTGFEKSVGLSADAIHVHVGVMLLFFFAWVTRRPLHDWRPWLMVFAVELAN